MYVTATYVQHTVSTVTTVTMNAGLQVRTWDCIKHQRDILSLGELYHTHIPVSAFNVRAYKYDICTKRSSKSNNPFLTTQADTINQLKHNSECHIQQNYMHNESLQTSTIVNIRDAKVTHK